MIFFFFWGEKGLYIFYCQTSFENCTLIFRKNLKTYILFYSILVLWKKKNFHYPPPPTLYGRVPALQNVMEQLFATPLPVVVLKPTHGRNSYNGMSVTGAIVVGFSAGIPSHVIELRKLPGYSLFLIVGRASVGKRVYRRNPFGYRPKGRASARRTLNTKSARFARVFICRRRNIPACNYRRGPPCGTIDHVP